MNKVKKLLLFFFVAVFGFGITANAETFDSNNNTNTERSSVKAPKGLNSFKATLSEDLYTDEGLTSMFFTGAGTASGTDYYTQTGSGTTYKRSYFKLVNGKWFHYRNVDVKSNMRLYTNFYYNANNCSTTTASAYNCTSKDVNSKGRVSSLDYYENYVESTGNYSFREVHTYQNNDLPYFSTYKAYNSAKKLTFYEVQTISNGKVTAVTEYAYDSKGRVISYVKITASSIVLQKKTYHSNNAVKMLDVYNYTGAGKYKGGYRKYYNSKKKITTYYIYAATSKVTHAEARAYYSNGKLKGRKIYKSSSKGVKTAAYYTVYRSTGKKYYYKRLYFKSGKEVKMAYYVYNKAGQAKSNKYGKAYKYTSTIKNRYVTKVVRAKYNAKGKLGAAKKVKITKATRTF